jgi:hypothetical protein
MSPLFGMPPDRETLRRLAGRPEQVVGAELLTREDGSERGVRVVRLRTGEIEAEIVVDRALDIAGASIRGIPVSWISPTGVAAPWFADPHGWGPFRTFFGGLLTTCGLEHTLGPAEDTAAQYNYPGQATHAFPLHGRLSTTPARLLGYGIDWDQHEPAVVIRGDVRQANVFGEVLTLEREIRAPLGGRTLRLRDRVRNDGYAPTPQMILYHVNAGWPLVGRNARVVGTLGEPRFASGPAQGVDWRTVDEPTRGIAEQVWEHSPIAGSDGLARAAVLNGNIGDGRALGLEIAFAVDTLPRMFQWRVMNEGHYVIGLEPGNLRIQGRHAARDAGDLVVLQPGEERAYRLDITLHQDAASVMAASSRLRQEDA